MPPLTAIFRSSSPSRKAQRRFVEKASRAPDSYEARQVMARALWDDILAAQAQRALKKAQGPYMAQALTEALVPSAIAVAQKYRPPCPAVPPGLPCADGLPLLSRQSILASGGQVADEVLGDPEMAHDFAVLARNPGAENRWVAFHLGSERAGSACAVFQNAILAEYSEIVVGPPATAPLMRKLLGALYFESEGVTQEDCIALATLIDYLGPRCHGPLNHIAQACRATFEKVQLSPDTFVKHAKELCAAGPALESWADYLAAFASTSERTRAKLVSCTPSEFRLITNSSKLALPADDALALARQWAAQHKATSQTAGEFLRQHGVGNCIDWGAVSDSLFWKCDQENMFSNETLGELVRLRHSRPPKLGPKLQNSDELSVEDSPDRRRFAVDWRIDNFAQRSASEIKSPSVSAAGCEWRIDLNMGVYLALESALPFRGTATYTLLHPSAVTEHKSLTTDLSTWTSEDWGFSWYQFGRGIADEMKLANSPWLGADRALHIRVTMNYPRIAAP